MKKDPKPSILNVRMSDELRRELEEVATLNNRSLSDQARLALAAWLHDHRHLLPNEEPTS